MKRFILFLLITVSVGWLGYVALDLINKNNNLEPSALFDANDKELLIILRPNEIDVNLLPEATNSVNYSLLERLNFQGFTSAYVSLTRKHLLLTHVEGWDQQRLNDLFNTSIRLENNSFKINGYSGIVQKTKLYLYAQKYPRLEQLSGLEFDKKSSALKCTIDSKHNITARTEIYVSEDGVMTYVAKKEVNAIGRKINDQKQFAKFIPSDFKSYHFREKDYWSQKDEVFAKGPMFLWMKNGFVELEIDGERVIISDFIEGQDPDLVLSDFTQQFDTARFSVPLTSSFPSGGKSYTYSYLEDVIVFSNSKEVCNKVIADHKLGNTIALDRVRSEKLFNKLPKEVSERHYSSSKIYAVSVYKNEVHESHLPLQTSITTNRSGETKPLSLTFGEDVHDFWFDPKNDGCFILGTNGKVAYYSKGKLLWAKELQLKPSTKIISLDLFDDGNIHFAFGSKDQLFLFAQNGASPTGFPAALDHTPVESPTFYRWKSGSYFLIPTEGGLLHLDGKGRELYVFKTGNRIEQPVIVWASQSKLYTGVIGGGQFVMFDIDRRREHRKFSLKSPSSSLKFPNEIFLYELDNGSFAKVDQKGIKTNLNAATGRFLQTERPLNRTLIIQNGNSIQLTNEHGISYAKISVPTSEIVSVDISQTANGKTIMALLDGMENNVYLYDSGGKSLNSKRLEGQKKVMLGTQGNELKLATVIDQFVVIYKINY